MAKKRRQDDEPIKKRKVGRPKKRGRKKVYYKPKKKKKSTKRKGFSSNTTYNRVRQVLWQNYKDDFVSYRAFISNQRDENGNPIKGTSIVSQVFAQCKSLECLDDDILEIYRQFRNQNPNDEPPVLPDDYYDIRYYWELITEDWWAGFDERIWVVSPMLLFDPDNFLGVLGSDRQVDANDQLLQRRFNAQQGDRLIEGKAKRFKEFVDYCNQLQAEGLIVGSQDVPRWRFTGESEEIDDTEVYWNPFTNRWEIKIVICEPNGDINNYDFDPKEPDAPIDEEEINRILGRQIPAERPAEIGQQEILDFDEQPPARLSQAEIRIRERELQIEEERLELEKAKSKRADALMNQFIKGKINAKTLEKLLKLI